MTKPIAKSASTFKEDLAELETLTTQLESDDIDLDTALEAFEKGSELVSRLQSQLEAAELKITQIQAQASGSTREDAPEEESLADS